MPPGLDGATLAPVHLRTFARECGAGGRCLRSCRADALDCPPCSGRGWRDETPGQENAL